MKLTDSLLKKLVFEEMSNLKEDNLVPPTKQKAGGATAAGVEGNVDLAKVAKILQIDPTKLKTAINNLKAGKRASTDNAIFGDLVAKLISASDNDVIVVMNIIKKFKSDE